METIPRNELAHGTEVADVLTVSLVLGCALDYAGLDAFKMLFWYAVINARPSTNPADPSLDEQSEGNGGAAPFRSSSNLLAG